MKKVISFLLVSFIFINVNAEDVKEILKKTYDKFAEESPVQLEFSINTKQIGDDLTHRQDGVAFMNLSQFKIDIPEATAWFDGVTQWIYVKDINEVNITNPSGTDLMAISPMVLLNVYQQGYEVSLVGHTVNNGMEVYEIAMKPESEDVSIGLIHLQIEKKTHQIKQIKISNDGLENTFTVNKYIPHATVVANVFVFDKKLCPGAEIVDLR